MRILDNNTYSDFVCQCYTRLVALFHKVVCISVIIAERECGCQEVPALEVLGPFVCDTRFIAVGVPAVPEFIFTWGSGSPSEHYASGLVDMTDTPKWDSVAPVRAENPAAASQRLAAMWGK